ncbi:MAG: TRAP-type mannitol/chloroaromatic compound transport system permease small subunit [Planctomycetota bacterium]|jgi:TRAP-type mannitol/chloroaromatic compound transport system permease small subunit
MRSLLPLSRSIDRINRAVGRFASWLTLVMVLVAAYNAVARYIGRAMGRELTSNAWVELQWYIFSLVFLLGAAHTLRANRHVRVDVLYGRLSARNQTRVDFWGGLLLLLPFCLFAIWCCWPMVRESISIREASPDPNGLPRWPIKASILLAFALLFLQGVSETIKRGAILRGSSPEDVGLHEVDTRSAKHENHKEQQV